MVGQLRDIQPTLEGIGMPCAVIGTPSMLVHAFNEYQPQIDTAGTWVETNLWTFTGRFGYPKSSHAKHRGALCKFLGDDERTVFTWACSDYARGVIIREDGASVPCDLDRAGFAPASYEAWTLPEPITAEDGDDWSTCTQAQGKTYGAREGFIQSQNLRLLDELVEFCEAEPLF